MLVFWASISYGVKVVLTVSESDADIYVDGIKIGNSPQVIKIPGRKCVDVEIRKIGFITEKRHWCDALDGQGIPEPARKQFVKMKKDEAYDSSISTDIANIDIGLVSNKPEDKAWKLITEVITTYFDVLEVTDKSSGYIKTAWVIHPFNGNTVRTMVILKASSSENPLKYKIKIISEISYEDGVKAKDDEKFKSWDRVLKKYSGLIPELQSRL